MDIHKIIEKREIYAKDLPFNEFPEWEINELTDNIANRAEAINILVCDVARAISYARAGNIRNII